MSELLNVYKLRTTKSHNKNLHFRYEKEGTELYIKSQNDGSYLLSKNKISKTPVTVKLNTYPIFTYIPMLKHIKEEGYFATLRQDDNYILRPATPDEIEKYAKTTKIKSSGYCEISSAYNAIHLIKEDYRRIYQTGHVKIHVVADSRLYVEAIPVNPDEAEELPSMVEAAKPYGGVSNLDKAMEYTYAINEKKTYKMFSMLPLPVSFLRKCKAKQGDVLHTWFREDGALIIEGSPIHCRICGRPINRYFDESETVYICKECNDVVPQARKLVYKGHKEEFDKVKKDLAEIRKLIESILS